MSDYACPLPDPTRRDPDILPQLLRAHRIAIVGLSPDPSRASFHVAQYLMEQGKEIIPVNPSHAQILGLTSYPDLESVPGKIDLVNVFRRPEFTPAIVESALKIHAGGVWLQSGITSPESARIASQAGLPFIQNRCLMVEHSRHARP
jgi:predicted CoA-binding protein